MRAKIKQVTPEEYLGLLKKFTNAPYIYQPMNSPMKIPKSLKDKNIVGKINGEWIEVINGG